MTWILIQSADLMTLEVNVGPAQLAINQGHSFLVSDPDGQIPWPSDKGLYFFDTRMISSWCIFANGYAWKLLNSGAITHYAVRAYMTNPTVHTERGDIPEHTLSLSLGRSLDGGIHEDIDITNNGLKTVRFNLEISVRSDFADLTEVRDKRVVRRGRIATEWLPNRAQLRTVYQNQDFVRELTIHIAKANSAALYANGRLSFDVKLDPGAAWSACVLYELGNGKARFEAPRECIADCRQSPVGRRTKSWKNVALKVRTSNDEFSQLFNQALNDMAHSGSLSRAGISSGSRPPLAFPGSWPCLVAIV